MRFNGPEGRAFNTNWALLSPGPDLTLIDPSTVPPYDTINPAWILLTAGGPNNWKLGRMALYDPSNGTVSRGNIWSLGGGGPQ